MALTRCDVLVLERDLPGLHGDEVCKTLAADRCPTRVLMLTAASTVADRVDGLGLGADDYLPKPFDFAELVARIRALGRRAGAPLPPVLDHGDLSVDPARRVAFREGRRLALTPKEFAVLECLLAAQGALITAEELLERVWDENADLFTTDRAAAAHHALRQPVHCVRGRPARLHVLAVLPSHRGQAVGPAAGNRLRASCHAARALKPPARSVPSRASNRLAQCVEGLGEVRAHAFDLHVLLEQSGIALAVMAAFAFALGWLVAGRVLRPLRAITGTAQRISATSLHERLALAGRQTTSSRNSPTPLTGCSPGWRRRLLRSGTSWPAPPMSCALR